MRAQLRLWGLVVEVLLVTTPAGWGATTEAVAVNADEYVRETMVTGDIVTVNKGTISVEFSNIATTAEEMLLPLDPKVTVEGPKKLSELRPGDRVRVHYRQTYRKDEHGKPVVLKTLVTTIALLKTALPEGTLRSSDEAVTP